MELKASGYEIYGFGDNKKVRPISRIDIKSYILATIAILIIGYFVFSNYLPNVLLYSIFCISLILTLLIIINVRLIKINKKNGETIIKLDKEYQETRLLASRQNNVINTLKTNNKKYEETIMGLDKTFHEKRLLASRQGIEIITLKANNNSYRKTIDTLQTENKRYRKKIGTLKTNNSKNLELINTLQTENKRYLELNEALLHNDPLKSIATLAADYKSLAFNEPIDWLKFKTRPALRSAELVDEIKSKFKLVQQDLNYEKYKRDYFLGLFPEFSTYFDDYESLSELEKYRNSDEIKDNHDYVKDYLTDTEWKILSTSEKNQLALDRYIKRQKTSWQIGRDFEMCCAWKLEQKGLKVLRYGIEHGKQDLGRDLIAFSERNETIYIIQCKCWKADRVIRENVIAQLYGTAFAFKKEWNAKPRLFEIYNHIKPVLAIPHFSNVSEVAKEFSKKLDVIIEKINYDDFPRIKCNINENSKIYHLPFDQQYDRTQISKPGEFYAYTVKEAESKGFRRAKKYLFNQ